MYALFETGIFGLETLKIDGATGSILSRTKVTGVDDNPAGLHQSNIHNRRQMQGVCQSKRHTIGDKHAVFVHICLYLKTNIVCLALFMPLLVHEFDGCSACFHLLPFYMSPLFINSFSDSSSDSWITIYFDLSSIYRSIYHQCIYSSFPSIYSISRLNTYPPILFLVRQTKRRANGYSTTLDEFFIIWMLILPPTGARVPLRVGQSTCTLLMQRRVLDPSSRSSNLHVPP